MKGITLKNNKYIVRKSFNGKQFYFGSYNTYEEAEQVLIWELRSRGLYEEPIANDDFEEADVVYKPTLKQRIYNKVFKNGYTIWHKLIDSIIVISLVATAYYFA